MPGDRKPKGDLIPMKTLAERSGVSVQTIHYYLREGLLIPPTKTARNMAYYDPRTVDDIKFIKELQSTRFLPLAAIKLLLQSRRSGQDMRHTNEIQSLLEDFYHTSNQEAGPTRLNIQQLQEASELLKAQIADLESLGFITPVKDKNGSTYDNFDLRIATIFKELISYGLTPQDLKIYRRYLTLIHAEVEALHALIHRLPNHDQIPMLKAFQVITQFKDTLIQRTFRKELLALFESNHSGEKP